MSRYRRWAVLAVGWVVLVLGLAALVLPGPGLVLVALGLAILGRHLPWAQRHLQPVQARAHAGAVALVRSPRRFVAPALLSALLVGLGVVWLVGPGVPTWWPLHPRWWLVGGPVTGISLVVSGSVSATVLLRTWSRRAELRLEHSPVPQRS
ncbi:PGPGW domain-containing protein [Auraticoccus monumenti]|uniref:Putative transmembrane protein (PGPGW) n=1 Tax=Auraticoccus monumenti TaxID=675864 RepID=A0A1G7BX15_9ACTN|nr:PGPGW domain-containing protein [Auraticoccus monumenti]SDE30936.1 Putative transmembrane protein (PGPGW) [Auraticoccus monumenti]